VFVSVLPLKTIVGRIGDGHVRVEAMVQPGQSPHSFEPTPRQVAELAKADLYVRTGMPFEDVWMGRFRAVNPRMRVLDARAGIRLRRHENEEHGHAMDPHVWTSPLLVKVIAHNIRDTLVELDPPHTRDYEANYAAFIAELSALDRQIHAILQGLPSRSFMVFHPAWGYFAETYGLTQIPVQREGKEPGAKALAALVDEARREGVKVIFVQPQLSSRAAEQLARAIHGRVETIDPLAPDYVENMLRVARLIAEAEKS
ncbi:MAG: zinc ABC transporter substrate-binding protein, partial [Chromatiaceae bacterium]